MQNSISTNQNHFDKIKENYAREMASLTWSDGANQLIMNVYELAARLYNTGYYSEFYGDIINPIGPDLTFPAEYNRGHFNAVVTIAMTMFQFKFPERFNQLCRDLGADNVAIWFTDAT